MPALTVESGPGAGRRLEFTRPVIVGRDESCDLTLDHRIVSRQHAMLRWAHGSCSIVDLNSANGTFVNGQRISKPTRLNDGDLIVVGTMRVRYSEGRERADTTSTAAVTWQEAKLTPTATRPLQAPAAADLRPTARPRQATEGLLPLVEGLARIAARPLDAATIASAILDGVLALLPSAECVSLLLTTREPGELTPLDSRTRQGPALAVHLNRPLLRHAIERREGALVTPDGGGRRSLLCVPVVVADAVVAVIHAESAEGARFTNDDLALLARAAACASFAIGYAQLQAQAAAQEAVDRELAIAEKVQQRFLPQRLPVLPGFDFGVHFAPAAGIGGDFYDVIQLSPDSVCLAVGDVCGKGVPAALYAAKVGSDLRYLAVGSTSAASILTRLNRALCESGQDDMFVTMVVTTIDAPSAGLRVASAGHPWPLRRDAEGRVHPVGSGPGVPLGVKGDAVFPEVACTLSPGDAVVWFTDGIYEALNADREPLDFGRLSAAIAASDGTARGVVAHVIQTLAAFVGEAPQSDDRTLLSLHYSP